MKLPYAERAVVDLAKLRDYCLSATHPEGKHKARVFASALNIGQSDAEWLRDELLQAVLREDCQPGSASEFGRRYAVDVVLRRDGKEARIRSAWIIRADEEMPRLATCYVL